MNSPEKLLLISGPVAAGKTAVRRVLTSSYGFGYIRSSSYLRELAEQRGLSQQRTTLQALGDELDLQTDYLWLLDRVARPQFAGSPLQGRWLVDAVRKRRQVEHFRASYGDAVLHVHLHAHDQVLRLRYAERGETTPYEVASQHENETAARGLVVLADFVIDTGVTSVDEAARQIAEHASYR